MRYLRIIKNSRFFSGPIVIYDLDDLWPSGAVAFYCIASGAHMSSCARALGYGHYRHRYVQYAFIYDIVGDVVP